MPFKGIKTRAPREKNPQQTALCRPRENVSNWKMVYLAFNFFSSPPPQNHPPTEYSAPSYLHPMRFKSPALLLSRINIRFLVIQIQSDIIESNMNSRDYCEPPSKRPNAFIPWCLNQSIRFVLYNICNLLDVCDLSNNNIFRCVLSMCAKSQIVAFIKITLPNFNFGQQRWHITPAGANRLPPHSDA